MSTVFAWSMAIGGLVLVAQIVLSLLGLVGDAPETVDDVDGASGALNLLSVRALAAGAVFYGAAGMMLLAQMPVWAAAIMALLPGLAAAAATAYLTRAMFRAETRGNLRLEDAAGQLGTVYLQVPGANAGTGLVQFALQGRTVELRAYTREPDTLSTGSAVLVVSVDPETETAEVIPTTSIEGLG
jgi:membrane protein implicated in regulation of membrane protease activity